MKKWLSGLLALVLMLTVCVGCGNQNADSSDGENTAAPSIFSDITGIASDEIVMTVDGIDVTAEQYFYWIAYVCSSLEYTIKSDYNTYGAYQEFIDTDGSVKWDVEFQDGSTVSEYAKIDAETTLKYRIAIEKMAAEMNVPLTEEDYADIDSSVAYGIEQMGGEEFFHNYLAVLGITEETFRDLSTTSYLFNNILNLVYQEGHELYLPLEDYNNYATYADHILFSSMDLTTGDYLSAETIADKLIVAQDVLDQLDAADPGELLELFNQLADEHSDDTGRAQYPDGYVYTPGSMVEEFENIASTLKPGEYSGLVQSDYGYHIILRKDLVAALEEDPEKKANVASEYLNDILMENAEDLVCEYDERIGRLNTGAFYEQYITEAEKLNALNSIQKETPGSVFYDDTTGEDADGAAG